MSRAQLMDLLKRHPHMASDMVSVFSQRLDSTNVCTFRDLTEKNRQLQQAYDELKAAQEQLIEKERLERELKVAAEIQMSILPDVCHPIQTLILAGEFCLPVRWVAIFMMSLSLVTTSSVF